MKIIYDAYGQMCNRLWEYLDQIAWAKIANNKVVSLFWDPSLEEFDNLRRNPYIKFPFFVKLLNKGFKGRVYRHLLFRLLHNKFIQGVFASSKFQNLGFVSGKEILHNHDYYPLVWKDIKSLFTPNKSITMRINEEFTKIRNSSKAKIVGVHIRRGDYKEYCEGRFYYSDKAYRCFMRQVCQVLGSQIVFFISSNDKIDVDAYKEFNLINIRNTKPVEDLYSLSMCDYIIGPYSSFSSWASFYGAVPYCRLERGMLLSLEKFVITKSFESSSSI